MALEHSTPHLGKIAPDEYEPEEDPDLVYERQVEQRRGRR